MSIRQQDYFIRHIETISRLVARLRNKRNVFAPQDEADLNEALLLALHLQEQNFGMPAAEFLAQPADAQLATLQRGETKAAGEQRCLNYATLLAETAELYALRRQPDLALGARQLALYVGLRVALGQPTEPAAVESLVLRLLAALDGAELHPPTLELLERYQQLLR